VSFLEGENFDLRKGVFFLTKNLPEIEHFADKQKQKSKKNDPGGPFISTERFYQGQPGPTRGISRGISKGLPP
jgi:hypothetical protein